VAAQLAVSQERLSSMKLISCVETGLRNWDETRLDKLKPSRSEHS
jgi:hypothetical protein